MMRPTIFAALVSVSLASPPVRQVDVVNVADVPGERTCTERSNRCAGEAGFENVPFADCCSDIQICAKPKGTPEAAWGFFCLDTKDAEPGSRLSSSGAAADKDNEDTAATGSTSGKTTGAKPAATKDDGKDAAAGKDDDKKDATSMTTETGGGIVNEENDKSVEPEGTGEGDGSVCFPADAKVELDTGATIRMDALSVGDMVKVGVNQFSRVFMFTHKMADAKNTFVTLKTATGAELSLTSGHYLYVNGALSAAKTVVAGDELTLGNGDRTSVTSVTSAQGTGLFNPQTVSGNVVVNGVQASTYTTAVEPSFAHAILSPFRALQNIGLTFTTLESGGGSLAGVAPRGQAAF